MKANEARKKSVRNAPTAKERQAKEYAEWKKKDLAAKRNETRVIHLEAKNMLRLIHKVIGDAAEHAKFNCDCPIGLFPNKRVMKIVERVLKNEGYEITHTWNTVITGVDEWDENHLYKIKW